MRSGSEATAGGRSAIQYYIEHICFHWLMMMMIEIWKTHVIHDGLS